MITLYINRITCVIWRIIWNTLPMFPHPNTINTRLTLLYIDLSRNFRIAPNGSLRKLWGYAAKWLHPP